MARRLPLLLTLALALAAPSSATASGMFFDEGKAIEGSEEVEIEGTFGFKAAALGGLMCDVHIVASIETNGGTTKKFEITPGTCSGHDKLASCKVKSASAANQPYSITPTESDFDLTGTIKFELAFEGCSYSATYFTASSITATPTDPSSLSEVFLTGSGTIDVFSPGEEKFGTAFTTGSVEAPGGGGPGVQPPSGEFLHEGQGGFGTVEAEFTGSAGFTSASGSLSCEIHAQASIEPKGGSLVSLEVTTGTCAGTGAFGLCTVTAATATNLPYTLTPTTGANDVGIKGNIVIDYTLGGGCGGGAATFTDAQMTAVPDNSEAIETLDLEGAAVLDTLLGPIPVTATGELEALPAGTLGVA